MDGYSSLYLLPTMYISLLGLVPFLYSAVFGRCLRALASPTSWALQCNPGFTITVLHNGFSEPLALSKLSWRDVPVAYSLVSVALLKTWRVNPWCLHVYILHASKVKTIRMTWPSMAVSLSCTLAPMKLCSIFYGVWKGLSLSFTSWKLSLIGSFSEATVPIIPVSRTLLKGSNFPISFSTNLG